MGTILQQRVPQQYPGRLHREQGCRKAAMWSEHRPSVDSYKTDRLQPQKKLQQLQNTSTQETVKKLQPRRKQKSVTSASNRMSKHSSQVTSESKSSVPSLANQASHNKPKHTRPKSTRHTAVFPCHRPLSDSSPDPSPRLSTVREVNDPGDLRDDNSDTDLSESERLSKLPSPGPPPQLDLRPEVIASEDPKLSLRDKHKAKFDFPDFLPPPFNSWNLSQLAIFYNMESRAASRPKPVGPLERYLERLMQLEWYQIQTWQDHTGTPPADPVSSSHRAPVSTSSRLSTPKCILQCQRAFPLTFLSSASSHCAYVLCRTRYPSCCCRPSRLSPTQERKGPTSVPKRSYSETRVPSFDRSHKLSSPVRTSGHLNWMQAAGNIRSTVQGANNKLHSTAKDQGPMGDVLEHRPGSVRTRNGSEHRKGNAERQHNCSEKRRGRSECRKGRAERRAQQEIKPDAVTAIMDNLPAAKHCGVNRPVRSKQVEFVT